MKKLCIALAVLALGIASCQGEDLVRGSLPPREQVKITADTGQIIIYFKGEIYPASLVTANIFVYESEGNTLNKLDFDVVFGTTGFPILRQATTVNDTLVLPFKSSFDLQPGKTYGLVMDNYQLLCAIEEEIPPGCLIRNYAFKMVFELATPDVYEPPYNEYNETYKNEDPPYVKRASPPDEIDFKDMNPSPPFPPFPPHGAIDIEFSEPLPNITLAAAADQTSIGDTIFSMIPEDVLILNGDSPGYFVPFDSNRHEHFLATTVKGWPINKTISFYMISIPRNLPEVIAECTAPEATSCTKPPLANIVLAPTRDASYAPIIMAGASAMVETSPGSGVYNGFYHQPAGEHGADGTEPDNIDILVHTARVRIDYPRAGGYFNLTKGNTISGIYYKEDRNVSSILGHSGFAISV